MLTKIEQSLEKASKRVLIICFATIVFVTFLIVVDIILRYVFNSPLPATIEMSELVLPIIAFPPLAYTLLADGHVRVTLLTDRLPPRFQLACGILINVVGLVIFGLLTYWSGMRFYSSVIIREEMLAAIPLPWYVGKFFFPLGTSMITAVFLMRLLIPVAHRLNKNKGLT